MKFGPFQAPGLVMKVLGYKDLVWGLRVAAPRAAVARAQIMKSELTVYLWPPKNYLFKEPISKKP